MRWISFFILAYLALGLQAGIALAMEWHNAAPNLVLLAVVFIALNAPRDTALLGCFILGAMQDLTGQAALGLHAFSYGLAALLVTAVQPAVHRRHPLTQFLLALLAGVITAAVMAVHGWIHPAAPANAALKLPAVHAAVLPLFYTAVYTALLAPLVIGLLQRMQGVFAFQGRRTKFVDRRWR